MNNYYNMPNNYQTDNNYQAQKKFYDPYQGFLRGNMETETYKPYLNQSPYEIMPINEQAKMLTNIDALSFAIIDLNLYLDVNPMNQEAINMFNQYRVEKENLVKNYENMYGPLTLDSNVLNTYPWMWNERPWPWER